MMDVAEIKLRKKVLETEIYKLLHQFESDTEMKVDRVSPMHSLKTRLHSVRTTEIVCSVEISLEFK